jgi:vancomycin resistance protein YoaR
MIPKRAKKDSKLFYASLLVVLFLFILGSALMTYYLDQEKEIGTSIYPNVFIDRNNVGHLSKVQANKFFLERENALKNIHLDIMYKDQQIATLSAQKLNVHSSSKEQIDRAYLIGRSQHIPSRIYQKIVTIFNLRKYYFNTTIEYDKGTVKDYVNSLEDQYNKPAKNALFTFENGRVVTFRVDEEGLRINSDKFILDIDRILSLMQKNPQASTITLTDSPVKPEISLNEANKFGIEELIGEGQSNYTHSIPERIYNVSLAASKFNGVIIEKGKVLSFNDIVGDISSSTGYKPAYVIKNGRTVLGDGGGVCQVSTTLFRAALNTGLPILERTAHAYRVGYYENDAKPGLDATVFGPYVDLKIKNDTTAAILLEVENDEENKILKFKIYGKKDGRLAEISPIRITDEQAAPPPVYQDDPTLKKGVVKQVDFAASGAKSTFTYKIHRADKSTEEKTFVSVYRPWAAVYLVGQAD